MRVELEIASARVIVKSSDSPTPASVIAKLKEVLRKDSEFEIIFCLFDRDSHSSYIFSIEEIGKLDKKSKSCKIVAVPSIPCFEIWFLLHFLRSTKPYGITGSPCDKVIKDLKQHPGFTNYKKSDCKSIYGELSMRVDNAIENAKSGLEQAKLSGSPIYCEDSSSRVYLIVEKLRKLKKKISP